MSPSTTVPHGLSDNSILGVVPLVFATGAGAEMRQVLGIAVFSGMLGVTLFGIFLTPVFFYVIDHAASYSLLRRETWRLIGGELADFATLGFARRGVAVAWTASVSLISRGAAFMRRLLVRSETKGPTP